MLINSNFDSGSIEVLNLDNSSNLKAIATVKVRKDTNSHFAGWFYFQISNIKQEALEIMFMDMNNTTYPLAWDNYNICFSFDNVNWYRNKTIYSNNILQCNFNLYKYHKNNDGDDYCYHNIYIAYFEPFSYFRHMNLIANFAHRFNISHEVLAQTHQGHNLDLLTIGHQANKYKIWFIARQHPGETMGEWFIEGLLKSLTNKHNSSINFLLEHCVFYIVANMNPDGSYLGNLRTNALGVNLNRQWHNTDYKNAVEVYAVKEKMLTTGVDMFFDIHGDEVLPYVFTDNCSADINFTQEQKLITDKFTNTLLQINNDYQTQYGYEAGHFSDENKTMAHYWVSFNFKCLSLVLEMPFKDNANLPNKRYGWNAVASMNLAQDFLTTIYKILL